MFRHLRIAVASAAIAASAAHGQAQTRHPLDPLDWDEHWIILETLRDAGRFNDSTRIALVRLEEPAKDAIWAWRPGGAPIARVARAVVRQQSRSFEAFVDVGSSRLVSWNELIGHQPNFLREELGGAADAVVMKHPDFIAAMRKRGITDFTFLECGGGPPGYFGTPEEAGRRLSHVTCVDSRRVRNTWPRQIAGVTVVYDVNEKKVLRVIDEGVVPVPQTRADLDERSVGPLRPASPPIHVTQPLGPSFVVDGNQVSWDRWSFHVRPDQRVGMVISTVRYRDGERQRPVLYAASLSEIFVPYMDSSRYWYARNFLDAGEYVAGGLAKPMEAGIDCPDHAVYFNTTLAQDDGRPAAVPRVICMFERASGDVVWRHRDRLGVEGRPKRDLVVRFTAVLGNYDYIFDWVFQQDGAIRVAVGSTGINEVKIVKDADVTVAQQSNGNGGAAARPDAFGRFVDRNVVAVNHDHYFNFRIDVDVDGSTNSFSVDRLETVTLPASHPRRSLWAVKGTVLRLESDAKLSADMHRPSLWRALSARSSNRNGYPTSYQLVPGMSIQTLLSADDYPRRRAGFIDHHLWVTPYNAAEQYAAGMYPTLSKPGEGLPKWTSANRAIEQTDIVLWYTMGMHHVARAEDWPVMPVHWNSFELRPFDFFDRNPSLALPKKP